MRSYESSATIDASPDAIWAVLTDAPEYAVWDSGVERVEGTIAPGETIKVHSEANPGRAFPVKVTEYRAGERMTWSGGMPLGLFKGVRTFTLTPEGAGPTRFHMREEYSGPLRERNGDPEAPMKPAVVRERVLAALDAHNEGHLALIFHPFLLTAGPDALSVVADVLARVAELDHVRMDEAAAALPAIAAENTRDC